MKRTDKKKSFLINPLRFFFCSHGKMSFFFAFLFRITKLDNGEAPREVIGTVMGSCHPHMSLMGIKHLSI